MLRGRAVRVAAIVAAAVLVGAAGLSLWPHRSPPRPEVVWGTGDAVVRDPDSTVYTAPTGVLFDVASSVLTPEAVPALRAIVAEVKRSHSDGTVWVEGYTDDVGSDDYNRVLSGDRARTVAKWLVKEAGVDGSRIRAIAFGENSPAQPNDSDVHRRANRRVVIAVERATGPDSSGTSTSAPTSG
jgi:outer membrane protein OmpA-like peptidoglycan-associated protein